MCTGSLWGANTEPEPFIAAEVIRVRAQCLPGTWWYQGVYMNDDGSFKAGTDAVAPIQFTC